jgi:hypothetical protein
MAQQLNELLILLEFTTQIAKASAFSVDQAQRAALQLWTYIALIAVQRNGLLSSIFIMLLRAHAN